MKLFKIVIYYIGFYLMFALCIIINLSFICQQNQNSISIDSTHSNEISLLINKDSIAKNNVGISHFTVDGQQHQLIYIDDTKENYFALFLFIFLAVVLITVIIYLLRKRKQLKSTLKHQLTKQEYIISELINTGKTNAEISESLFISLSTVKTHINNIYRKLNISSREELKKFFNKSNNY